MRIVSLAPSNTEILYELGAGDQIVGTTSLCDHPETVKNKPSLGGWTNPNYDKLEELEPDLVLASDDLQDNIVEEVKKLGIKISQVKPHTLEEVYNSIEKIGQIIDKEKEAYELVNRMRSDLDNIHLEKKHRIYCEEWVEPQMVSGNWIPGLIEKIGGDYPIEEGVRSREIELNLLQRFDPEYIILNVCGAGTGIDEKVVRERDQWENISAVQNENIYVVDDVLLNRPGPRLVDGARRIKKIID